MLHSISSLVITSVRNRTICFVTKVRRWSSIVSLIPSTSGRVYSSATIDGPNRRPLTNKSMGDNLMTCSPCQDRGIRFSLVGPSYFRTVQGIHHVPVSFRLGNWEYSRQTFVYVTKVERRSSRWFVLVLNRRSEGGWSGERKDKNNFKIDWNQSKRIRTIMGELKKWSTVLKHRVVTKSCSGN